MNKTALVERAIRPIENDFRMELVPESETSNCKGQEQQGGRGLQDVSEAGFEDAPIQNLKSTIAYQSPYTSCARSPAGATSCGCIWFVWGTRSWGMLLTRRGVWGNCWPTQLMKTRRIGRWMSSSHNLSQQPNSPNSPAWCSTPSASSSPWKRRAVLWISRLTSRFRSIWRGASPSSVGIWKIYLWRGRAAPARRARLDQESPIERILFLFDSQATILLSVSHFVWGRCVRVPVVVALGFVVAEQL